MASKETITALYQRYLANQATQEELQEFLASLDSPEDEATVRALMDATWQEMFDTPATKQTKVVPLRKINWLRLTVAASVIGIISITTFFLLNKKTEPPTAQTQEQPLKNDVAPGGNKAILTLANGTKIILDSANNGTLAKQAGTTVTKLDSGSLMYNAAKTSPEGGGTEGVSQYNTITTPKGGQYQITLADGTRVWLNAQSSLTFPTSFNGDQRTIQMTGEGYFEVAKQTIKGSRQRMPFIVQFSTAAGNSGQVEVLGTHFNINAYSDEATIKTTLLEGSVKVTRPTTNDQRSTILQPGQQSVLTVNGQQTTINDINLDEVVAWKNGLFLLKNADIGSIMRQVARWYDVDIEYEKGVPQGHITGKVPRNTNLSNLLKVLEFSGIKFEIDNKKIIVKP